MWFLLRIISGMNTGRIDQQGHIPPKSRNTAPGLAPIIALPREVFIDTATRQSAVVGNEKCYVNNNILNTPQEIVKAVQEINFAENRIDKVFDKLQHIFLETKQLVTKNKLAKLGLLITAFTAPIVVLTASPWIAALQVPTYLLFLGVARAFAYFSKGGNALVEQIRFTDKAPLQNVVKQFKVHETSLAAVSVTIDGQTKSLKQWCEEKLTATDNNQEVSYANGVFKLDYRAAGPAFEVFDDLLRRAVVGIEQKFESGKAVSKAEQEVLHELRNMHYFSRGLTPIGGRPVAMADHMFLKIKRSDFQANFKNVFVESAGVCISEAQDNTDEYIVQVNCYATDAEIKTLLAGLKPTAVESARAIRIATKITRRYVSPYRERYQAVEDIKTTMGNLKVRPKASILTYFMNGGPAGALLQDLYSSTENMTSAPFLMALTVDINSDNGTGSFLYETIGKIVNARITEARRNYILKHYGERINKLLKSSAGSGSGQQQERRNRNVFLLSLLLSDLQGRSASGVQMKHMALEEALSRTFASNGYSRSNIQDLLHQIGLANAGEGIDSKNQDLQAACKKYGIDHSKLALGDREVFVETLVELLTKANEEITKVTGVSKLSVDSLTQTDLQRFANTYYDNYVWMVEEEKAINGLVKKLVVSGTGEPELIHELAALIAKRFAVESADLEAILAEMFAGAQVKRMEAAVVDATSKQINIPGKKGVHSDGMDYLRNVSVDIFQKAKMTTMAMAYQDQLAEQAFIGNVEIVGPLVQAEKTDYPKELAERIKSISIEMRGKMEALYPNVFQVTYEKKKEKDAEGKDVEVVKDKASVGGVFELMRRRFMMDVFKPYLAQQNLSVKELEEKELVFDQLATVFALATYEQWESINFAQENQVADALPGGSVFQKEQSAFEHKMELLSSSNIVDILGKDELYKSLFTLLPNAQEILSEYQEQCLDIAQEIIADVQAHQMNMTVGLLTWMGGVEGQYRILKEAKLKERIQDKASGFDGYMASALAQYRTAKNAFSEVIKESKFMSVMNEVLTKSLIKVAGDINGNQKGWILDTGTAIDRLSEAYEKLKQGVVDRTITVNTTRDLGFRGVADDSCPREDIDKILLDNPQAKDVMSALFANAWDMDSKVYVRSRAEYELKELLVAGKVTQKQAEKLAKIIAAVRQRNRDKDEYYDRAAQVNLDNDFFNIPVSFAGKKELQDKLLKAGKLIALDPANQLYELVADWQKGLSREILEGTLAAIQEMQDKLQAEKPKLQAYYEQRATLREILFNYFESEIGINRREVTITLVNDVLDKGEITEQGLLDLLKNTYKRDNRGPNNALVEKLFGDYVAAYGQDTATPERGNVTDAYDLSMLYYDRHGIEIAKYQKPNNTDVFSVGQTLAEQIRMIIENVIKERDTKWPGMSLVQCLEKVKYEYFMTDDKAVNLDTRVERGKRFAFWNLAEKFLNAMDKEQVHSMQELLAKDIAKYGLSDEERYLVGSAKLAFKDRNDFEFFSNADKDNFFYADALDVLFWGWGAEVGADERIRITRNKYTVMFQGNQDFVYENANQLQKASIADMIDFNKRTAFIESEEGVMPPTGCGGWRHDYFVRTKATLDIVQRKEPAVVEAAEIVRDYLKLKDFAKTFEAKVNELRAIVKAHPEDKAMALEVAHLEKTLKEINKQIQDKKKKYGSWRGLDDKKIDLDKINLADFEKNNFHKRLRSRNQLAVLGTGVVGGLLTVGAIFLAPVSVAIATAVAAVLIPAAIAQVSRSVNPIVRGVSDILLRGGLGFAISGVLTMGLFAATSALFGIAALPFIFAAGALLTLLSTLSVFKYVPSLTALQDKLQRKPLQVKKIVVRWETEKGDSAVEDAAARNGIVFSNYNSELIPNPIFYADAEGDYTVAKGQFMRWFAAQVELIVRENRDRKLADVLLKELNWHSEIVQRKKEVFNSAELQHTFPLMSFPQFAFIFAISGFTVAGISAFLFWPVMGVSAILIMAGMSVVSIASYNKLMAGLQQLRVANGFSFMDGKNSVARMGTITMELMEILLSIIYEKATLGFNATKPVDPPVKPQIPDRLKRVKRAVSAAVFLGVVRIGLSLFEIISLQTLPMLWVSLGSIAFFLAFVFDDRSIRRIPILKNIISPIGDVLQKFLDAITRKPHQALNNEKGVMSLAKLSTPAGLATSAVVIGGLSYILGAMGMYVGLGVSMVGLVYWLLNTMNTVDQNEQFLKNIPAVNAQKKVMDRLNKSFSVMDRASSQVLRR